MWLTHAMMWMDLEATKGHTVCDSIDRKHPGQENQQAGGGLVGDRAGEGQRDTKGTKFLSGGIKMF